MFKSRCKWMGVVATLLVFGCELDPQEYRFGENLTGLQFEFYDEEEGVHPSQVVLPNPRNPFRDYPIGSETKWDLLDGAGTAAGFYAWATLLAQAPTGEHQFYAAAKLRDVFFANEVEPEDNDRVRLLAIDGFQTVLDDFPDSVTFDPTGTIAFRLATPSYLAILELNGRPQGDWVLVLDSSGNPTAVKGAGVDIPRVEPVEEEDDS